MWDSEKLARGKLRLLEFELEVVHYAGIKYQAPNTLPKLKTEMTEKIKFDGELPVLNINETEKQEYA